MYFDKFDVKMDDIYNKERKSEFAYFAYSHMGDNEVGKIINFFNSIGQYEHQHSKDFCDFSFDDVVNAFERSGWKKFSTFSTIRSTLKNYVEWCRVNGKTAAGVHPIERLQYEDIKGHKKFDLSYFESFEKLKECLEYVYDSIDSIDKNRYIAEKIMFCLSWFGLNKDEIRFLLKTDVDLQNRSIHVSSTGYSVDGVDEYIVKLLYEYINQDSFAKSNRRTIYNAKLDDNKYVMRTFASKKRDSNDPISPSFFNNTVTRFRDTTSLFDPIDEFYKKNITPKTMYDSGRYYRLLIYEGQYGKIDYKHPKTKEIGRLTSSSEIVAVQFYKDYEGWRNYYYPNT